MRLGGQLAAQRNLLRAQGLQRVGQLWILLLDLTSRRLVAFLSIAIDKLLNILLHALQVRLNRGIGFIGQLALGFQRQRNLALTGSLPLVRIVGGLQHGTQAIVVALRDRVVLVVVAAGAAHGQSHQG